MNNWSLRGLIESIWKWEIFGWGGALYILLERTESVLCFLGRGNNSDVLSERIRLFDLFDGFETSKLVTTWAWRAVSGDLWEFFRETVATWWETGGKLTDWESSISLKDDDIEESLDEFGSLVLIDGLPEENETSETDAGVSEKDGSEFDKNDPPVKSSSRCDAGILLTGFFIDFWAFAVGDRSKESSVAFWWGVGKGSLVSLIW